MIRNESKCTEDHSYVISVSRQLERAKGMPIHEFLFITVVMDSHHMVDKCKRRFFFCIYCLNKNANPINFTMMILTKTKAGITG